MLIEDIRSEVEDMYPGESWRKKVARMSDNQVIAIYHSKYDRKKKSEEKAVHWNHNENDKPIAKNVKVVVEDDVAHFSGFYVPRSDEKIHMGFEQITFEDLVEGR